MPLLLLIETATSSCSIALASGDEILAVKELDEQNIHASHITLFISEVMQAAGKIIKDLDGVAVSMGPGSYTGLRIGVSTAKGLCFGLDIPLIGITTLESMAYGLSDEAYDLFCPMLDARRMEVYSAVYSKEMKLISPIEAKIITAGAYSEFTDRKIVFFGSGASKCREFLDIGQSTVLDDFQNSATHLAVPALKKYRDGVFEDVAYFEPYYLKDFIISKPLR